MTYFDDPDETKTDGDESDAGSDAGGETPASDETPAE